MTTMPDMPKIIVEIPTDDIAEKVAAAVKYKLSEFLRDALHVGGEAKLRDAVNNLVRDVFYGLIEDPSFKEDVRSALRAGLLEAIANKAKSNVHLTKEQLRLFAEEITK